MSFLSIGNYKKKSGKIHTLKAVQEEESSNGRLSNTSKISFCITSLPGEFQNLVFRFLGTRDDRNSFGLTCRRWFQIQNDNQKSLWWRHRSWYIKQYPKISPESFPMPFFKLLSRFQNLKYLSLSRCPKITVFAKPRFFESNVQYLCLDDCYDYSDGELSTLFSWFPHLIDVSLESTDITDKGLEALAKSCSSLDKVNLSRCDLITDSGISYLLRNCHKIGSLKIGHKRYWFPRVCIDVNPSGSELKPEGINAIVSGGGIEYRCINTECEDFKRLSFIQEVEAKFCGGGDKKMGSYRTELQ